MYLIAYRFKKYFENVSWLLIEKGFSLFVGAVVGIYVARYLRPESFGLLNYSISFVGIFSVFSTLGLDQIMVRELAQKPERRNELLGTGFILKLSGSCLLLALMAIILLFMNQGTFTNTLIIVIAIAEVAKAFEVVNYFYQANVLSKYVVSTQLTVNLLISLAKIGLVFFQAPLIWFALIIPIGTGCNAIGYLFTYRARTGAVRDWNFSKEIALRLVKESWPLTLYGLALHIQARIDQVMLGNMLNNYEVGQYSVALKFIEIFGFIPMILLSTFMPAVSKAKVTGEYLYQSRLLNLYRLMFIAFLLVSLPIFFLAEKVVTVLYGMEYQPAGYLLSLFALRLFFSNMGVGKSVFIVNEGLFRYSLLTVIVGALVNIVLNYFLIPLFASAGSILASILSFTVSIFLLDLFFEKTRHNQKLMVQGIFSFWRLNGVQ